MLISYGLPRLPAPLCPIYRDHGQCSHGAQTYPTAERVLNMIDTPLPCFNIHSFIASNLVYFAHAFRYLTASCPFPIPFGQPLIQTLYLTSQVIAVLPISPKTRSSKTKSIKYPPNLSHDAKHTFNIVCCWYNVKARGTKRLSAVTTLTVFEPDDKAHSHALP